jgi:hypothetical protein
MKNSIRSRISIRINNFTLVRGCRELLTLRRVGVSLTGKTQSGNMALC